MNQHQPRSPPSGDVPPTAEATLSPELLSQALAAAANAIVITDRDGLVRWANPAFTALTGFAAGEAIGRKPGDLVGSGEQSDAFYRELWQRIAAGDVWRGELVNRRKDGSRYHEELTITPVRDGDGAIGHYIAVKQDISARKEAERALREREAYFRLFYEHAPVAYQSLDAQGHLLDVNDMWLEQFGYRREEVLGRWIGEFLVPGQASLLHQRFAEFLRQGSINKAEYDVRCRDGEHLTVSVDGRVERDEHGQFRRTHCVLHNITARKRLEETLARLATTDHLTGLANRRHFLEHMVVAMARHRRHGHPTALLMVDLDHFKHINDGHGHASGDAVLRQFAETMRRVVRNIDSVGRLGGEEFAILLPDTDLDGALDLAQRLRGEVARAPVMADGSEIRYTLSAGITLFRAEDRDTDAILARADRALYRAKQAGRDRVEVEIGVPRGTRAG